LVAFVFRPESSVVCAQAPTGTVQAGNEQSIFNEPPNPSRHTLTLPFSNGGIRVARKNHPYAARSLREGMDNANAEIGHREFGLSDVGLAKLRRRHEIPVPSRGYWYGSNSSTKMVPGARLAHNSHRVIPAIAFEIEVAG